MVFGASLGFKTFVLFFLDPSNFPISDLIDFGSVRTILMEIGIAIFYRFATKKHVETQPNNRRHQGRDNQQKNKGGLVSRLLYTLRHVIQRQMRLGMLSRELRL